MRRPVGGEALRDPPPFPQLRFPESPARVFVQEAGNERLVGKSLLERTFLDRFRMLGRNPNAQPAILFERRLRVAIVSALGSRARAQIATCHAPPSRGSLCRPHQAS